MDTMNQSEQSNKPFSVRLIEDLTILLGGAFFFSGLRMDSVEMDPVEGDEERVTAFGDEFVFTIKATAYYCSPKGRTQNDVDTKKGDQQ
jgi:hypothetical protein